MLPESLEPLTPAKLIPLPVEGGNVDDESAIGRSTSKQSGESSLGSDTVDGTLAEAADEIDVLIVYTPVARAAPGGTAAIEALIALAAAETNLADVNAE